MAKGKVTELKGAVLRFVTFASLTLSKWQHIASLLAQIVRAATYWCVREYGLGEVRLG